MDRPRSLQAGEAGIETAGTTRVVGISDMAVECGGEGYLVTYSLGSCLGLTLFDPVIRAGGMIHCMLPLSSVDAAKAAGTPLMFVDTGIPILLQAMFEAGARRRNLECRVAGCASISSPTNHFNIGERNYAVARKVLWKNDILITAEDVGGYKPRTMFLRLADGRTVVRTGREEREL